MADRLHLSERGVALILRDLRNSGYISGQRDGRRVYYTVVDDNRLPRPPLSELVRLLAEEESARAGTRVGSTSGSD